MVVVILAGCSNHFDCIPAKYATESSEWKSGYVAFFNSNRLRPEIERSKEYKSGWLIAAMDDAEDQAFVARQLRNAIVKQDKEVQKLSGEKW
jgi:hypothetical protein